MTETVDVAAIRAALAKAAPGPWEWRGVNGHPEFPSAESLCGPTADVLYGEWHNDNTAGLAIVNMADAELIVLLRNNAEALLDEIERLRHRLE
jgi:hypothetical protein